MNGLNTVILGGNLTRDLELRKTPGGQSVSELGLAINEDYKNKNGESVSRTCFVDVVTWDRQAELCAEYLRKGSPVLVEGKLQLDQWESPQGEKRSRIRVRAFRVQFLGGRDRQKPGPAEDGTELAANGAGAAGDDGLPF